MADIKLSGGEISFLKTIGFSGAPMPGKLLIDRIGDMESAEFVDALDGLLTMDYVLSDRSNVRSMADVERSFFRINPAHARELREAAFPSQRREERVRRRRRG